MITFFDEHCNELSSHLPPSESKHAVKALRIRPKERFNVINGKGLILQCEASENISEPLQYTIIDIKKASQKKPLLHLAISPLKQSDRFEFFIEKSIELGIHEITPILCSRTERSRLKEDRLERIIIAALKQSGNPFRPTLNEAKNFNAFITECEEKLRFIGHCTDDIKTPLSDLSFTDDTLFVIGPEGDFSEDELKMASEQKFIPVSFGDYTLRTETAGLTACAYFQQSK